MASSKKRIRAAPPVDVRICPDGPLYNFSKMPLKKLKKAAECLFSPTNEESEGTSSKEQAQIGTARVEALVQHHVLHPDLTGTSSKEQHSLPHPDLAGDKWDITGEEGLEAVYVSLLKQYSGCIPTNESASEFVMQCLNLEEHGLVDNKYVTLKRRQILLSSAEEAWISSCSCDQRRLAVVGALADSVDETLQGLCSQLGPQCIHISALDTIVSGFEISVCPEIPEGDYLFEVNDSHPIVGVHADGSSAVVGVEKGLLKCFTCSHNKACVHTLYLSPMLEREDAADESSADVHSVHHIRCSLKPVHSRHPTKLPYSAVSKEAIALLPSLVQKDLVCPDAHGITEFKPDGGICTECGELLCSDRSNCQSVTVGIYPFVTYDRIQRARVFGLQCSRCGTLCMFDGSKEGVLNMGSILISHMVLRDYLLHFVHGRSTLYRYYLVLCERQADAQDSMALGFKAKVSYHLFRSAWLHYVSLLDLQMDSAFYCPDEHCGSAPQVMICDATALAFRQQYDCWKDLLHDQQGRACGSTAAVEGSRFTERVPIADKKTRQLLKKFSLATQASPFSDSLFAELLVFAQLHSASLYCVLKCFSASKYPPFAVQPLLRELSTPSPACSWIHPSSEMVETLHSIISGQPLRSNPTHLKVMQKFSPILFQVLSSSETEAYLPALRLLLKDLLTVSLNPFASCQKPVEDVGSACTESPSDMAYYPSLPVVRNRGVYVADRISTERDKCKKNSLRHPSLLPGIFTVFCPHGVCYGFEVMRQNESPAVPFKFFLTRFVRAPKAIIYDNACNLHSYALNRDPGHFQNTFFFVDRFHWDNHTACSRGYNISLYPDYQSVNTEVVEQANSDLSNLKSSLSYMNKCNFVSHLKLFLYYRNKKFLQL